MEKLKVINPATLEHLADVDIWDQKRVDAAVAKAWEAFETWKKTTFRRRRTLLHALKDEIRKRRNEIAEVIVKENGKPFIEAIAYDIFPVMEFITYYADHAEEILRREYLDIGKWGLMRRESYLDYAPLGVIGVISPWNFPFSLAMGPIIQALAAGNTVVLKPSELTTLTGLKIGELFKGAGFPEGVVEVATGDGRTGAALVKSKVRKIVFTGSVATGKKIMSLAGEDLKPVILELGGKDPMIVLEDAHLPTAIKGAAWAAFINCGQVCCSVERLYIHKNVYQPFLAGVVDEVRKLRQGNGMDPTTDIGPVISERQLQIVESHVEDARKQGGKIEVGGERNKELKGYFYKPTVISQATHKMKGVCEETFGPTLPVLSFDRVEDAIKWSNDSAYGLTASIWTSRRRRAEEIASQLEYGSVSINDHGATYGITQTPWGGWKHSGIGRTHGTIGLKEMTETRHVHTNKGYKMANPMWFGYNQAKVKRARAALDLLYGNGVIGRVGGFLRSLREP